MIHSPFSGRSAQLNQALSYLQHPHLEIVETISIADLDGLPSQGASWKIQGIDIAVAAGGDGLVGGVITHIIESDLVLGILPLGTSNDIARSIGIPQNLQLAAAAIAEGQIIRVDVGKAQPAEQTPHLASPEHHHPTPVSPQVSPQQHGFFAHTLTVGVNVEFARLATNIALRQRYRNLTYPLAALEVLRKHSSLDLKMEFVGLTPVHGTQPIKENPTLHAHVLLVAVINAPIFGGALQFALPGARIDDHLLDIVVVEDIDLESLKARLIRFFNRSEQLPILPTSWHEHYPELHPAELSGIPGIHHVRAHGVFITTNVDPQDVTLDGEVRGQTPIYTRMADTQLQVLVPR